MRLGFSDEETEHMARHGQGELVLAEKYLAGVFLFQERGFLFTVRAHNRVDARIDRAGGLDHAANVESIRRRDYEQAGAVNMGLDKNRGIRSIAEDGRDVACAQLLDNLPVCLSNDK